MINKNNWKLTKKYLAHRLEVDQITLGSLQKEKTHLRYLLEWAQDKPFISASSIRPTFPEYLLSTRLDGRQGKLSGVYIKKALATARLFFTWLSDNVTGYRSVKQIWINSLKVKRLPEVPKTRDAVSLEEVHAIAAMSARTVSDRRARAAAVFLFLSGMRIGAFVSLPLRLVDIPNRTVIQDPNLGVRTKNKKYIVTTLLDIPELLQVVQEWDDKIRPILSPNAYWFAMLTPETAQIDTRVQHVAESRTSLATRNIKAWMVANGLPYHSPHKFRHGHIQYAQALAKSVSDYKAISLNVGHANMEITDQFYSNINDGEVKNRISKLGKNEKEKEQDDFALFQKFLEWERRNRENN